MKLQGCLGVQFIEAAKECLDGFEEVNWQKALAMQNDILRIVFAHH